MMDKNEFNKAIKENEIIKHIGERTSWAINRIDDLIKEIESLKKEIKSLDRSS